MKKMKKFDVLEIKKATDNEKKNPKYIIFDELGVPQMTNRIQL